MRDSSLDAVSRQKEPKAASKFTYLDDTEQTLSQKLNFIFQDDQTSLENNTHHGRKKAGKKRKEKELVGQEDTVTVFEGANPTKLVKTGDFIESSHFFIDTLKQEFCTKKEDGWFEFEQPVKPEDLQADKEMEGFKVIKPITSGRWRQAEHQLFLEALQLYGKDWELIQKHVGTRDIHMVRSHAQKFLIRLVKFLEGKTKIAKMTDEEAQFYYGTLKQKLHKSQKVEVKEETMEDEGEVESVQSKQSRFQVWKKEASLKESKRTDYSIGHSVKIMLHQSEEGSLKMSFKNLFQVEPVDDVEVMSDNSFKYPHIDMYPLSDCSHGPGGEPVPKVKRKPQLKQAIKLMQDIDSDDEDPDIELHFPEAGLKFLAFKNITQTTYLKCFFMIEKPAVKQLHPNLYRYMEASVRREMMAKESLVSFSGHTPLEHHLFDRFVSIDVAKAEVFMRQPPEKQLTSVEVTYFSKRNPLTTQTFEGSLEYMPLTENMIRQFQKMEGLPASERGICIKKLVKSYSCLECVSQNAHIVEPIHEAIVSGEAPEGVEVTLLKKME